MPFFIIFIINLFATGIAFYNTSNEKQERIVLFFGTINASIILLAWIAYIYLVAFDVVPNETIKLL